MKNTIKCPKCGVDFELSEGLAHKLIEEALESAKKDHAKDIEDVSKKAEAEALEKISKKFDLEIQTAKKDAEEEKERSRKLISEIGKLTDEIRQLRRKDEERDVEFKKKLLDGEEKIREDVAKIEREKAKYDIDELKKKNEDMQKALDIAKAKGSQKSQQLQGEVLELDLEEKLKSSFIYDDILPVGKGVQGADIIHKVKNQQGKVAGIILWETKRAKWTLSWIPKLKEDGRKSDATMTILVCENLPQEIENYKVVDGVIVTSIEHAVSLAGILRRDVMHIAAAKSASENKDEKLENLYEYIQSDAFRHRFEAFSDSVKIMEEDLLTEKRSMERIWKKRETQINRIQLNTSRMFGELQGEMGDKLPDIKTLSLDGGEE